MRVNPKQNNLLFWLWPFGAFLIAVSNIRFKAYHPVILLFSFVYGYSVYMYSGDIVRYAESFQMFTYTDWSDYGYLLKQSFTGEDYGVGSYGVMSTKPDIYAITLQFLVSRVTDNARWFFAIVSLIYTWFYLKFLDELLPEIRWTGAIWQKVFFVYLLVVIPFYVGVTGVRFWTALYLFMTFALRYVKYSRMKDLFWASTAFFIHYTFAFPVALLVVYRIVKLNKLASVIFVLSGLLFFAVTSNEQVASYIRSTSTLFEETSIEENIVSYTDQQILAQRAEKVESANWYVQVRGVALPYFLIATFLLELVGFFKWKQNGFLQKLYPLYTIFFVVTLFTLNLGSIGRFKNIFYLLALARYTMLFGFNPNNKYLKNVSLLLAPVLLLHIIVMARAGFYTVDPLLLVSPPFVFFFTQSKLSLSEFLVGH